MKQFLKLFLSICNRNCTSVIFTFTDGTQQTITGQPICTDILKATKSIMTDKLAWSCGLKREQEVKPVKEEKK